MRFASGPENRSPVVLSTALAVLVSVSAGVGLVLTSGDSDSVTAAPSPSNTQPATPETATDTGTSIVTRRSATASTSTASAPRTGTTTAVTPDAAVVAATPITPTPATTTAPAATLTAGSAVKDVAELQRQLNVVTSSALTLDGIYGEGTHTAVRKFQAVVGLTPTGVADPVTRWTLAEAASRVVLPTIGAGGANGCQVAVVGDSLMAGGEALHADSLARVGCASAVDGEGGRSLAYGWQCRVERNGRRPLLLYDERIPGNDTCAPSGLTLLASWADASALGDVVVVALGTNDAGLYEKSRWQRNWAETMRLAGGRPVVFVTTQARSGSDQHSRQNSYSNALRQWCGSERLCVLADWANTAAAFNDASYVDSVHLSLAATRARASFIADVVAALLTGQPIPNPQPPPTPTVPPTDTMTANTMTTNTMTTDTTTTTVPTLATTTTTEPSIPTTPAVTIAPTTTTPASTTSAAVTTTTATTTTATTTTMTTAAGSPDTDG